MPRVCDQVFILLANGFMIEAGDVLWHSIRQIAPQTFHQVPGLGCVGPPFAQHLLKHMYSLVA